MRIKSILLLGLVAMAGCSDAGFVLLYSDDFDRANGNLASSTWLTKETGGTLTLVSSRVYAVQTGGASPSAIHQTSASSTSLRVKVDLIVSGGTITAPVAMILARRDGNDPAVASTSAYACGFGGSSSIIIMRGASTVATGSATATLSNGAEFTLTFTQEGSLLTCAISGDATDSTTYTDAAVLTGAYQGFIGGLVGEDFLYLDNFLVYGK